MSLLIFLELGHTSNIIEEKGSHSIFKVIDAGYKISFQECSNSHSPIPSTDESLSFTLPTSVEFLK
jgi:hypothetical protein